MLYIIFVIFELNHNCLAVCVQLAGLTLMMCRWSLVMLWRQVLPGVRTDGHSQPNQQKPMETIGQTFPVCQVNTKSMDTIFIILICKLNTILISRTGVTKFCWLSHFDISGIVFCGVKQHFLTGFLICVILPV